MRSVDSLEVDEELVVQYGASSYVPRSCTAHRFMAYPDVFESMRRARVVIAHGGVGSILTAIHARKHPVVVPRQRRYSEAVDDHQGELASRLAERGVVTVVLDLDELPSCLESVPDLAASAAASSDLADAIGEYVDSVLGVVPS
jgi:UDP-N-acetylglucosamine transferase subunit ALG13